MSQEYIKPQRRFADVIIPHGSHNKVAIEFVSTNLKSELSKRVNLEAKLKNDIDSIMNVQFQPRGNSQITWDQFFGANLGLIEAQCRDQMKQFGIEDMTNTLQLE